MQKYKKKLEARLSLILTNQMSRFFACNSKIILYGKQLHFHQCSMREMTVCYSSLQWTSHRHLCNHKEKQ